MTECEHDWIDIASDGEKRRIHLQCCGVCSAQRAWAHKLDALTWMRHASDAIASCQALYEMCGDPDLELFCMQLATIQTSMVSTMIASLSADDREKLRQNMGMDEARFAALCGGLQAMADLTPPGQAVCQCLGS